MRRLKSRPGNYPETSESYIRLLQHRVQISEETRRAHVTLFTLSCDRIILWLYERCARKADIEAYMELSEGAIKTVMTRQVIKQQY